MVLRALRRDAQAFGRCGKQMQYILREIKKTEYPLLQAFLYEAIFIPEGVSPPPRSILQMPELQVYIENFGTSPHDHCLIAEVKGEVVGAVWARIMEDYGHIDEQTPSLAIALHKAHRGQGIGTALLQAMLDLLREKGYGRVSLAVQKANAAVRLYRKTGFQIVNENEEEYIMAYKLQR